MAPLWKGIFLRPVTYLEIPIYRLKGLSISFICCSVDPLLSQEIPFLWGKLCRFSGVTVNLSTMATLGKIMAFVERF